MKTQLLKHAWLSFRRSPTLTRNIFQTILVSFLGVYFILVMLGLALGIRFFIEDALPGQDLLLVVGGGIGYYFLSDLLMRYFLQKFPTLAIKPYMALPIKKSSLSHYILQRSLSSFFNILPLFFLVPFFFKDILPTYPEVAVNFALFVVGMILLNNYVSLWISKSLAVKSSWSGLILFGVVLLFFLESQGYFSLFEHLKTRVSGILQSPFLSGLPLLFAVGWYLFLHRFFQKALNLERSPSEQNLLGANLAIGWFDRFGDAGKLMDLELKLILRSKRARAYVIPCFLIMLYPIFMLQTMEDVVDSPYMLLGIGMLLTSAIGINYGQIILSWNSLHFDLLMSRGHTIKDIFKAKYYFLALTCLLTFGLSLPYFVVLPPIALYTSVMLLYGLTFCLFGYLFLASYTALRIDPNEGGAFSFDGFGVSHYLIIFPILGLPFILFFLGEAAGGKAAGLLAIAIPSILMLVFHQQLLDAV
ncbi:MAG: DUF5687 family protein, partial [Bacteroidota bacterium]